MIGKDSGSLDVELFLLLFEFRLSSRRRALGWPLAASQEEHLSYCVGSPLYAGRLEDFIDPGMFNQVCFFIQLPASGGIAS